ncbi:MAG: hypothetical protein ACO20H_07890 [Bacteriovoracaceae bacterium]
MKASIYQGGPVQGTSKERNYLNSRMALLECLPGKALKLEDLEIIDYLYLKNAPEFKVSISHTQEFGAAVVSQEKEILSVGIDIELQERPMRSGSEKYFVNEQDMPAPSLKLWILKEAAFKALSPLVKAEYPNLLLKNIWIKDNVFGISPYDRPLGHIQIEKINQYGKDFYQALAWIKSPFCL